MIDDQENDTRLSDIDVRMACLNLANAYQTALMSTGMHSTVGVIERAAEYAEFVLGGID